MAVQSSAEIAQWVREERERVEALMNRLRSEVAVVPRAGRDNWIRKVHQAFEHLRAHLIRHMLLEERDGYMSMVIERRPALSPEVERLRHEHEEFRVLLDEVYATLERLHPDDNLLVRDCCNRIHNLISYVEHHENDENLMVTYVFTHDLGIMD